MSITPASGYIVDPNNPNGVVKADSVSTYVNPNANYFSQPVAPAPVSVLSSNAGQNVVNTNTNNLQKIESGYTGGSIVDFLNSGGKASDFASRTKLAGENGIANYTGTADQNTQLLGKLQNISSSPTSQKMVTDINGSIGTAGMTAGETKGFTDLTKTQDDVTTAAANARAALEAKDYRSMDYWTAKAQENNKIYQDQLAKYYDSTKSLRDTLTASLTPGAREQQIAQDLNSIRAQADAFKLQTEQDKYNEYEGQTLGFAGGRANQIDVKASFKNQEFLLKEKNLLASLGLEQDARKMQGDAAKTGLGYLADDFDLQQKVQDKIDKQEEDLFNKADKLQTDSKNTLISMLDGLQGVDPSHMDANSIAQLETMAARSGIPFDLVKQALKTQYDKRVFDETIKRNHENKPTSDDKSNAEVAKVSGQLTKAVGTDGYTDPNLYARTRASSTLSATDFDNRFAYLVNPASRAKLGLTATNAGNQKFTSEEIKQTIHQQMATSSWKQGSKDQQRNYILSLGADPADFGL